MNLHNDLMKSKIEHDCSQCVNKCKRYFTCIEFLPGDMWGFMENMVDTLKETVVPSKEKKLRRRPVKSKIPYDDKLPPVDYYFVLFINNTLSEIRNGHTAYIFSLEQLREIMRFEPDVRVAYNPEAESYVLRLK